MLYASVFAVDPACVQDTPGWGSSEYQFDLAIGLFARVIKEINEKGE